MLSYTKISKLDNPCYIYCASISNLNHTCPDRSPAAKTSASSSPSPVPSGNSTLNLRNTVPRIYLSSVIARFEPGHARAPCPNGIQFRRIRSVACSQRCGLHSTAAGYTSSTRPWSSADVDVITPEGTVSPSTQMWSPCPRYRSSGPGIIGYSRIVSRSTPSRKGRSSILRSSIAVGSGNVARSSACSVSCACGCWASWWQANAAVWDVVELPAASISTI